MFCFIFVEGDDPDCFTEFIVYKKNGKCNSNKQRKCFHYQSELKMCCVNYKVWRSYKCARNARN